jgi:hypothetical protein
LSREAAIVSKVQHRAVLLGLALTAMLLTAGRRVSAFPEYPNALQSHFNQLKGPCGPSTELPCDTDGDGKPDYAELAKGEDPERSGAGSSDCPKYGCGASHIAPVSPASDLDVSLACSALAAALLLRRRRRS